MKWVCLYTQWVCSSPRSQEMSQRICLSHAFFPQSSRGFLSAECSAWPCLFVPRLWTPRWRFSSQSYISTSSFSLGLVTVLFSLITIFNLDEVLVVLVPRLSLLAISICEVYVVPYFPKCSPCLLLFIQLVLAPNSHQWLRLRGCYARQEIGMQLSNQIWDLNKIKHHCFSSVSKSNVMTYSIYSRTLKPFYTVIFKKINMHGL